jgi:hypothetical protein
MSRPTEQDVKAIIDTELTEAQITPFLRVAHVLVDDVVASDTDYSDDLQEQLELWLAAHFVAIRDPRVQSITVDDVKATFHGKSGLGLDHTPYGQQLRLIDTKGLLVNALLGLISAEIKVLG